MINYRLSIRNAHEHLVGVEIEIPEVVGSSTEVRMPSWTPGSYLLREFARHVQEFEAVDRDGAALNWTKTDKACWRIDTDQGSAPVTVRYRVFADELSVRTNHVDSTHAYLNGASTLMWVVGAEDEPARIKIDATDGWRVATALKGDDGGLTAENYDEIVDSPIEIGEHRSLAWEQEGLPHRWAIWPASASVDEGQLLNDSRKIVEAASTLYGGLPYSGYLFQLHVVPGGYGGLEHRESTSLQIAPENLSGEGYERLQALAAHELFHVWLGKRIRPETLGPFDYSAENYTRNLWVIEGFTTYYTDRLLVRAGLMTADRYLQKLGDMIARLQTLPGRKHQSLEESSFDTWIRFYRPDAHTPNSQVSYYQKGALVALVLDLEIRRATAGARSLDDVLGILWNRYGSRDTGFPEDRATGIQAIVEEVGGAEIGELLVRYVTTTEEIDFDRHLDAAGLELGGSDSGSAEEGGKSEGAAEEGAKPEARTKPMIDPSPPPVHELKLGIRLSEKGDGGPRVTHVLAGSAAWEAGINSGDELVSVGGRKASVAELKRTLESASVGDRVAVTLFRREQQMEIEVQLDGGAERLAILREREAPPEAVRLRTDWLKG